MTLINKKQLLDAVMKKSYSQASIQLINDQPEVKAIPIEWLCRKYLDITSKSWASGIRLVLNKVINDWEKENEIG